MILNTTYLYNNSAANLLVCLLSPYAFNYYFFDIYNVSTSPFAGIYGLCRYTYIYDVLFQSLYIIALSLHFLLFFWIYTNVST